MAGVGSGDKAKFLWQASFPGGLLVFTCGGMGVDKILINLA